MKLIPALRRHGLSVAAIKHTQHDHAIDVPGKDSSRLRAAGAVEVALSAPGGCAFFGPPIATVAQISRRFGPVDVVLCEGASSERPPRIEIHRREINPKFLCEKDKRVIAIVTDEPPPRTLPTFRATQHVRLAAFVAEYVEGQK